MSPYLPRRTFWLFATLTWCTISPASANPATVQSFYWTVHGETDAHSDASCAPQNCGPSTSCSSAPWTPSFSDSGSTLANIGTMSYHALRSCSTACIYAPGIPCCTGGVSSGGGSHADVTILDSSSPSQTRWIIGTAMSCNASAGGGDPCAPGAADAMGAAQHSWQLTFEANCTRLLLSRTHILTYSQGTGDMMGVSSIMIVGPNGTLFSQMLTPPSPGSSTNGSGSSEFVIGPGQYMLTIDSQISASALFPPGESANVQVYALCDLTFTLHTDPPSISAQPADGEMCEGGTAIFNVAAGGPGPIAYQWRRAGLDLTDGPSGFGSIIVGANTASLNIVNAGPADADVYDCVVSNPCTGTDSSDATLTVFPGGTGDGNADGTVDGDDIQGMLNALASGGPPSAAWCAYDMDANGAVEMQDVPLFVAVLFD